MPREHSSLIRLLARVLKARQIVFFWNLNAHSFCRSGFSARPGVSCREYGLIRFGANVSYPVSARPALATSLRAGHCRHVRIVSLIMLSIFAFQARAADPVFGTWKLNAARSTFAGDTQPKSLTVRIEPHAKGEVFTLDRTETNGRSTSSSVLLYFDGRVRAFNEAGCSGTQSSQRLDSRTVEIHHDCTGGLSTRIVRRSGLRPNEIALEITDQYPDGRHYERRLVLERQ